MMDKPTDNHDGNPHGMIWMGTPTEAMGGDEMMAPGFFDVSLTNVNTGESFNILQTFQEKSY